jgi:hypothetical protein
LLHSVTKGHTLPEPPTFPLDHESENGSKRRKLGTLSNIAIKHNDGLQKIKLPTRDLLVSLPPDGTPLSYAQKQYHSVWLAVPPKEALASSPRPPPRLRARKVSNKGVEIKEVDGVEGHISNPNSIDSKLGASIAGRVGLRTVKSTFMKKSFASVSVPSTKPRSRPVSKPKESSKKHKAVNRSTLMKQKVKSYPRSRVHYYNKVVKPKIGKRQYYFVLFFDEKTEIIRIVPMQARGLLTGKREGRPRYQALIGDTDINFLTVQAKDYQIVNSAMVMKTPVVALEAWDIEDD